MPEIKEYKVNVPQEKIDRLMRRLDDTEFPTELEDDPGWQYGSPMYTISTANCWTGRLTFLGLTSNVSSITGATNSTGENTNER